MDTIHSDIKSDFYLPRTIMFNKHSFRYYLKFILIKMGACGIRLNVDRGARQTISAHAEIQVPEIVLLCSCRAFFSLLIPQAPLRN